MSSVVRIALTETVGVGLLVVVVVFTRHGLLAIRYGLGWVAVATAIIVAGPFLEFLPDVVGWLGLTASGFGLGLGLVFLMLVCLQLSISISGLHAAIQNLSERSALLEQRVRDLERARVLSEEDGVRPAERVPLSPSNRTE